MTNVSFEEELNFTAHGAPTYAQAGIEGTLIRTILPSLRHW